MFDSTINVAVNTWFIRSPRQGYILLFPREVPYDWGQETQQKSSKCLIVDLYILPLHNPDFKQKILNCPKFQWLQFIQISSKYFIKYPLNSQLLLQYNATQEKN